MGIVVKTNSGEEAVCLDRMRYCLRQRISLIK